MPSWDKWLNHEENYHHKKKINKNIFCKKNKQHGGSYGKHVYETNSSFCKLCGHKDKKPQYPIDITESNDTIGMEKENE